MSDQQMNNRAIAVAWRNAWGKEQFRVKMIVGSVVFCSILIFFPSFFSMIERRKGPLLDDWILGSFVARDVSLPTFIIIWSMTAFMVFRSLADPALTLRFLICIIILFLFRCIAIMLFPLDPPLGLIPLKDPLSSLVYGGKDVFITKDLFFSGHTSVQFLIFLLIENKKEKIIGLLATIAVGTLVLVQHVHYVIDVLGAIPIAWVAYTWGKKIANF